MNNREYGLVAVGELLGDFIGSEISNNLYDAAKFDRFQGGSPANLASNMARLGFKTAIISAVGTDNLGKYLVEKVQEAGVDTSLVIYDKNEPSSIVLVSRTTGTPDFIPYRTADRMINPEDIPDELLKKAAVFHTTCWPLSKQPSQSAVLDAAQRAKAAGCVLSADLNFAERVWPDRTEAHRVIKEYLSHGALIKLSEDDAERFYGEEVAEDRIFEDFFSWGAELICFTKGSKGSVVLWNKGKSRIENQPKAVNVVDATGAGDSFWSGFLAAYLAGKSPEICATAGANMARIKLTTVGPIKENVDLERLFE
ncbi:MAG: carbohydrate kinase [Cytophagaceae bacterium]|nr:carbohydrate kinase [Cytophagaceae bacterium]